jgi:hypothetical protein
MKFLAILTLVGLIGVARAGTEEQEECVASCTNDDVKCKAGCFSSASPTPQQIADTNNCIQQNCKVLDSKQATKCQIDCVYNNFLSKGKTSADSGNDNGNVDNPSSANMLSSGIGLGVSLSVVAAGALMN